MTETVPELRAFAIEDLPALQRIRHAAFAPVFASFRRIVGPEIAGIALAGADAEQAALLERLCAPDSGSTVLGAALGGKPVGFVAFTPAVETGMGEIGLNAVHPDHAARGIGTMMYEHVLQLMKASGMRLATVATGGDASHAPARRAYAKAGFGPALPSLFLYRRL